MWLSYVSVDLLWKWIEYWIENLPQFYSHARLLWIYKNFREIRWQNRKHNTCVFLVLCTIKVLTTVNNTLDLISDIESSVCWFAHFLFTFTTFVPVYIRFVQPLLCWIFIKSYIDYLMSFYRSHFVLLKKKQQTPVWKFMANPHCTEHMPLMSPEEKKP